MGITAKPSRSVARGETNGICVDWGDNTPGEETGVLKASDIVVSCVAEVDSKPDGASDPTLGSVTVSDAELFINERLCSPGEATTCRFTTAADQLPGVYVLKFTATTERGYVIPRLLRLNVVTE